MPGDAAVEGVLAGLEVDLLRLPGAAAVGFQLESRVRAIEHEVVDPVRGGQLDLGDPRVGGDVLRLEVVVAGLDRDGLGGRSLRLDEAAAAAAVAAPAARGEEHRGEQREGEDREDAAER